MKALSIGRGSAILVAAAGLWLGCSQRATEQGALSSSGSGGASAPSGAGGAAGAGGAGAAGGAPTSTGAGGAAGGAGGAATDGAGGVAATGGAGSAGGASAGNGATCSGCASWGQPVAQGNLPSLLPELSGLAASWRYPGILYTHNDSGDTAHFWAMNESAQIAAELRLAGATALDWEDIAVGPCAAGSCVYVADIGDNSAVRPEYTIYRVPEPAVLPTDGSAISPSFDRLTFVYPDSGGSHNSEALLVHPQSGRLFVIIKMGGRPTVYEMPQPLTPGQRKTLVAVGTLPLPAADSIVTGADFHPCGERMLVRTVDSLYEFSAPGQPPEALFAATPVKVPVAVEPQGEAVAYARDGRRYFTSSETGAQPQPLSAVTCQSALQ